MKTSAPADHFTEYGWALVPVLDRSALDRLRSWVDEVASWPDQGRGWLQYREQTESGPVLCRSENFLPFHDGLRDLLTAGPMAETAAALLGEPAVLYKEKINYKLPGGAGYAPHQDAPAYPFVTSHVSCMLAVDDATTVNGCLELVSGLHDELLPTDDAGCIRSEVVHSLNWQPVELAAGEALWFHSRTPHRSGPNRSDRPRRAVYPTYNAAAEGDLRDNYYRQKLATFAASDPHAGAVRVSLIDDFQGRAVR